MDLIDLEETEILSTWNMVYNISLNMLHNEMDAEDATQQIFEKVILNIQKFQHRSAFSTWVYRIAFNHLMDFKKRRFNDEISFDAFSRDVTSFEPYESGLNLTREEERIYIEQIKIGCTLALLQCLKKESRLVYILGNIFSFQGKEGAEICGMTEVQFRKELSRSQERIRNFMNRNCGLINPEAPCKCRRRLAIAIDRKRVNMDQLLHTDVSGRISDFKEELNSMDEISRIYRSNPFRDRSSLFDSAMKEKFRILQENP